MTKKGIIKKHLTRIGAFALTLTTVATFMVACKKNADEVAAVDTGETLKLILDKQEQIVTQLDKIIDAKYPAGSGYTCDIYSVKDYYANIDETLEYSSLQVVADGAKNGKAIDATFNFAATTENLETIKSISSMSEQIVSNAVTPIADFNAEETMATLMETLTTFIKDNQNNCTVTETSYTKEQIEVAPLAVTSKILVCLTGDPSAMQIQKAIKVLDKAEGTEFVSYIAPLSQPTLDKETKIASARYKFISEFGPTSISFDVVVSYPGDINIKPSQLKENAIKWIKGEEVREELTITMDTNSINATNGIGSSTYYVINQTTEAIKEDSVSVE